MGLLVWASSIVTSLTMSVGLIGIANELSLLSYSVTVGLLALRGFTHSSLPRLFMPAGFVELPA